MAVDDHVADQSQRCQPRTVAMLPLLPLPAATTVFPVTGRDLSLPVGFRRATRRNGRIAVSGEDGVRSETVQDDTRHLVLDLGAHL